MIYIPAPLIIFILLIILLPILLLLIQFNIIETALGNLGFTPFQSFLFLMASLIGSMINIPVFRKDADNMVIEHKHFLPMMKHNMMKTVIAVNVGGFLIPLIISLKLMGSINPGSLIAGTAIVALVSYYSSNPVKHAGIRVSFIAPLIAVVLLSVVMMPALMRPRFAYIIGTMGIIIGADLLHLKDINKIGPGVLSIGGAGVFDSIFFIGILAAFIL